MLKFSNLSGVWEAANHSKNSAMEAENHVKHGARSKSLMSRGNFLVIACLFLLAVLGGCQKEKEKEEEKNKPFRYDKVNISDAKYLISSEQQSKSATKSSSSDSYGFNKILENGEIEPVRFIDEHGDTISQEIWIYDVVNVNSDFLFFFGVFPYFDENGAEGAYDILLANKKTEKIYAIPVNMTGQFFGVNSNFFSDVKGNIYVVGSTDNNSDRPIRSILKINTVDNTIEELPFGQDEGVGIVWIDRDGICLYSGLTGTKTRHTSNWFQITPVEFIDFGGSWSVLLGGDGYIYFIITSSADGLRTIDVNRIDGVNSATLLSTQNLTGYIYHSRSNHTNNNLIFIASDYLYELNMADFSWRSFQLSFSAYFYGTPLVAQNSLYFFPDDGSKKIFRLDLNTYEDSEINASLSDYEIYGVTTSIYSDEIQFTGMRYSDSKYIAFSINASGNVTIIAESGENNIHTVKLIPLN